MDVALAYFKIKDVVENIFKDQIDTSSAIIRKLFHSFTIIMAKLRTHNAILKVNFRNN